MKTSKLPLQAKLLSLAAEQLGTSLCTKNSTLSTARVFGSIERMK